MDDESKISCKILHLEQGDAVTALVHNPYAVPDFPTLATLGEKRIFFWKFRLEGERTKEEGWVLSKEIADFAGRSVESMSSGAYVGAAVLVSGSYKGSMYFWNGAKLADIIKAHSGPIFDIKLNVDEESFATCGADGLVKIWSTAPGGTLPEIIKALEVSAIIAHISIIDESRKSLGYLMLKPHETLADVRRLIETSATSDVFIDHRIREMTKESNVRFLFVTGKSQRALLDCILSAHVLASAFFVLTISSWLDRSRGDPSSGAARSAQSI